MPLRAIINGEDIFSFDLTNIQWEQLREKIKSRQVNISFPCCDSSVGLRTSKLGTNHFYHITKGDCISAPETAEHLLAKRDIVIACREMGYESIAEYTQDDWRADVMAIKGGVRIAFEVQWSPQNMECTMQRQERYKNADVRGCWFFKSPPKDYQASRDLPLFKLEVADGVCTVIFNPSGYDSWQEYNNRTIPLSDFVKNLVSKKLKFCDEVRAKKRQKIRMIFTEIDCWKCKKPFHIYYLDDLKSPCGNNISIDIFNHQMITIAMDFVKSREGQHIRLGEIKKRYSKTVNESYMSFGCPHCDAIVGNHYLHHEILMEVLYHEDSSPAILEKEVVLSDQFRQSEPHWCFPEDGKFCC